MFVKICGLRTAGDVAVAAGGGADAVGFVLTDSVRRVDAAAVPLLAEGLPPQVLTVGVFRGEPVRTIRRSVEISGVRAVQVHGSYGPAEFGALRELGRPLIRAVNLSGQALPRYGAWGEDMLLIDSPAAGSGQVWDWPAAMPALAGGLRGRWILAGGLRPDNVADAVRHLHPWGVDVSSGVERERGIKDPALIRRFLTAARQAAAAAPSPPA